MVYIIYNYEAYEGCSEPLYAFDTFTEAYNTKVGLETRFKNTEFRIATIGMNRANSESFYIL